MVCNTFVALEKKSKHKMIKKTWAVPDCERNSMAGLPMKVFDIFF